MLNFCEEFVNVDHSRFLSIPSAFVLLPEFPYYIPEVGCGQRPRKKQSIQCLICHAKKSKRMYKILSDGYTVNRKIDSTAKPYISISYQKDSLSKDTRFFTASTCPNTSIKMGHTLFGSTALSFILPSYSIYQFV